MPNHRMPDHDALLHTAHLQWGYVTITQAQANGFSRQLCNYYCRKGAWYHVARSIYRIRAVPERVDEDLVRLSLLARDKRGRPAGVLSHHTALYLQGMLDERPAAVHISLDPLSRPFEPEGTVVFHRRIDLPWRVAGLPTNPVVAVTPPEYRDVPAPQRDPWAEPWNARANATGPPEVGRHPSLPAEDIEDRGSFRVTTPLRSVLDVMAWRRQHDLSDVVERGLRLGLFDVDAYLNGIEGLLRFPGERAMWELLRAVRTRADTVVHDLERIRLRILSVQHGSQARFGRSGAAYDGVDERIGDRIDRVRDAARGAAEETGEEPGEEPGEDGTGP